MKNLGMGGEIIHERAPRATALLRCRSYGGVAKRPGNGFAFNRFRTSSPVHGFVPNSLKTATPTTPTFWVLRYFSAAYDSRTGPKRNAATASVLCRKPFNLQLRLGRHDMTRFSHRGFSSVQDIEAVDGQNNLKAQIRFVPDHD